jgi:hypothetical protein
MTTTYSDLLEKVLDCYGFDYEEGNKVELNISSFSGKLVTSLTPDTDIVISVKLKLVASQLFHVVSDLTELSNVSSGEGYSHPESTKSDFVYMALFFSIRMLEDWNNIARKNFDARAKEVLKNVNFKL